MTTTTFIVRDSINGPRYTDIVLASGHAVTVRNSDKRVTTGAYQPDAEGVTAVDANPDLFEMKRVGASIAHDDHYVFTGDICDCGCVQGNYPCEYGSAGEGCGY